MVEAIPCVPQTGFFLLNTQEDPLHEGLRVCALAGETDCTEWPSRWAAQA